MSYLSLESINITTVHVYTNFSPSIPIPDKHNNEPI